MKNDEGTSRAKLLLSALTLTIRALKIIGRRSEDPTSRFVAKDCVSTILASLSSDPKILDAVEALLNEFSNESDDRPEVN